MAVFLCTWNPDRWDISDQEWSSRVKELAAGGTYEERWSTGSRTSGIHPGDFVFLVRQGRERGIVASGVAVSVAYRDLHWDVDKAAENQLANYVTVEWDCQVEIANRLKTESLLQDFPEVAWNNLMGSGVHVDEAVEDALIDKWFDHLGIEVTTFPDETSRYFEGASKAVMVNRYERNPAARKECLRIFGAKCAVCGFDGERVYGSAGKALIHVHHVIELSEVGAGYEVDPATDLVPLCPNCHAMIHRRRPAYSIEELKALLKK